MNTFRLFILLAFLTVTAVGQNSAPSKYWIKLTDKNNSPYSINNPSQYLSARGRRGGHESFPSHSDTDRE